MKNILITVFVSFILIVFSTDHSIANIVDSVGITKVNDKTYMQYLVEPGETIYGLSNKFKISVEDLLDLNPQLNNGLKTGQLILVPLLVSTKDVSNIDRNDGAKMYHTVQPGETYYSLSKRYGIPVSDLVMMNMPELKVGQEIVLKTDKVKTNAVVEKPSTVKPEIVENKEKIIVSEKVAPESITKITEVVSEDYDNSTKRILVIPFDPHLYWSDADMEIAKGSKTDINKVRQAFRKRLNALLNPEGYETIHLLGGKMKDSLTDLNRVYSSVSYDYKDVMYTAANPKPDPVQPNKKGNLKENLNNSLDKVTNIFSKKDDEEVAQQPEQKHSSRAVHAKNPAKYFSVQIKDPNFWTYFNNKYKIDYYIFINQFEVETNYENCLDRSRQNYERNFVTHFSVYDKSGKQIAGHRIILHYNSNSNNLSQIMKDNLETVANRIIAEIPKN